MTDLHHLQRLMSNDSPIHEKTKLPHRNTFLSLTSFAFAIERPNILFALADDWGLHAGAYGTPWVKTPVFDRIAIEGLLFENAYHEVTFPSFI